MSKLTFIPAGDMRQDPAALHLVAVNMQPGVLGAGQAKAYATLWPSLPQIHRVAIERGDLKLGKGYSTFKRGMDPGRRHAYLFPTKDHWKGTSLIEWIEDGLNSLVDDLHSADFRWANSIACPAIGCGLGSLRWEDVKPLIVEAAKATPHIAWRVYEPGAERRIA